VKLTLIGGGGVRSPLFVMSLLHWHERLGLQELCLMDIDAHKLHLMGELCLQIVRRAGNPFRLTTTTDARQALTGAAHVVTTIRAGQDRGRAVDERIALRHGVLGQETTGPGGFAMALRSIPALLEYARLLQEVSPGAWMYNFTNPSGLVAQALQDAGFERTVGICDGANAGQAALAGWLGVEPERVRAEVYGLNHLSWCRRAWVAGREQMQTALQDERFLQQAQPLFDPQLVRQAGAYCNEYLYYYYYAEQAVASITAAGQTRGEEIVELNQRLLEQLEEIGIQRDPERALRAFFGYEARRSATYMHYGSPPERQLLFDAEIPVSAGEGYAGVALAVMDALINGGPCFTALNVPNRGAIAGMAETDVVEVSCQVDAAGIQPLPVGEIAPAQLNLMRTVKLYERLTVAAVQQRKRQTAVQALMVHPLVLSYPRAKILVEEYLAAHAAEVGDWR